MRGINIILGCVCCWMAISACAEKKLNCVQESTIDFKEDSSEKSRDDKYTFLIMSYEPEFNLEQLRLYKDSDLISGYKLAGNYDNAQNDPKRIEIHVSKNEVGKFTLKFKGTCYRILLKRTFDNYIIDYDLSTGMFSGYANNNEYLTFE